MAGRTLRAASLLGALAASWGCNAILGISDLGDGGEVEEGGSDGGGGQDAHSVKEGGHENPDSRAKDAAKDGHEKDSTMGGGSGGTGGSGGSGGSAEADSAAESGESGAGGSGGVDAGGGGGTGGAGGTGGTGAGGVAGSGGSGGGGGSGAGGSGGKGGSGGSAGSGAGGSGGEAGSGGTGGSGGSGGGGAGGSGGSGGSGVSCATAPEGTSCGSEEVCHAGSCVSGCYAQGTFYAPGYETIGCQTCDPTTSTSTLVAGPNGTNCGGEAGRTCYNGSCLSGCYIAETFYPSIARLPVGSPGAPNPSNPCQVCEPLTSTTEWTDVANCVAPPSCATSGEGTTNCGPGGSGTESCCTSLEILGDFSPYNRTYTSESDGGATAEADPATVSGFRLDKYLVTVGRFRPFVNAVVNVPSEGGAAWYPANEAGRHTYLNGGSGLANSAGSGGAYESGWSTAWNTDVAPTDANLNCNASYATWTPTIGGQENLPINCVNWYEAYAFCIWDGGFLPSEAEWEYAAAAGYEQREYPWGSTPPGTACPGTGCEYAIYNCDYPSGTGSCTGFANITPVGYASLGAGYWGQLDLAGELYEWNLDWYNTYVDPCTDCAYLPAAPASSRVFRGSFFKSNATNLLPSYRSGGTPSYRDYYSGFRCARTP